MRTCLGFAYRNLGLGLAERGQRRAEGPPLGWIKVGLDSYGDPDSLTLHGAWGKSHRLTHPLVMWRTKSASWRSHPNSYGMLHRLPMGLRSEQTTRGFGGLECAL